MVAFEGAKTLTKRQSSDHLLPNSALRSLWVPMQSGPNYHSQQRQPKKRSVNTCLACIYCHLVWLLKRLLWCSEAQAVDSRNAPRITHACPSNNTITNVLPSVPGIPKINSHIDGRGKLQQRSHI